MSTLVEKLLSDMSKKDVEQYPSLYGYKTWKKRGERMEEVIMSKHPINVFDIIIPDSKPEEYASAIGKQVIAEHNKWQQDEFLTWGKLMNSCITNAKNNYWTNIDELAQKYNVEIVMSNNNMYEYIKNCHGYYHYMSSTYEIKYYTIAVIKNTECINIYDIRKSVEDEIVGCIYRGLTNMITNNSVTRSVENIKLMNGHVYNVDGICIGFHIRRKLSDETLMKVRSIK